MTWIVIPCPYHCEILNLAHDNPLTGHLEIKKMYIMAFFLAWLEERCGALLYLLSYMAVAWEAESHYSSCSSVSLLVVCEPYKQAVISCCQFNSQFLLTVMCASTTFSEAIPLHKITTPVIVKALTKFFFMF